MRNRLNQDYYFWCCDWCDSENMMPWIKLQEGAYCGACHRPMTLPNIRGAVMESTTAAEF